MAIGRITYKDKIDYKIEGQNDENKITAKDMNEIKTVFNDSADIIETTIEDTEKLQDKLEDSIKIMGTYKFEDGKVYFMKGDGTWGTPISLEISAEEFENLFKRVDTLEDVGVQVADTLPIGSQTLFIGDKDDIPSNWEIVEPPKQLIINNDFQCNQRGKAIYNNGGYTLDMWKTTQSLNTLTVNDGYITLENKSDVNTCAIIQINNEFDVTKEYTLTVKFKDDDNIYSITTKAGETKDVEILEGINLQFYYNTKRVSLALKPLKKMDIEYMDCFEGNIVYPHNKEDYSIALLKCKKWVQSFTQSTPIRFEYVNVYKYLCTIEYDKMNKIPSIVYCAYSYYKEDSNVANGTTYELSRTYDCSILLTTSLGIKVKPQCYSILFDIVLSCEPL